MRLEEYLSVATVLMVKWFTASVQMIDFEQATAKLTVIMIKKDWTLLVITQIICQHKNLLGNKQWWVIDGIKHCEKRLPLK